MADIDPTPSKEEKLEENEKSSVPSPHPSKPFASPSHLHFNFPSEQQPDPAKPSEEQFSPPKPLEEEQSSPPKPSEQTLPFQSPPSKPGFQCRCDADTPNPPSQEGLPKFSVGFSPPLNYRPIRAPALLTPPNTQAVIAAPVPQACQVPLLSPPYTFQEPLKKISNPNDIEIFHLSDAGKTFLGFVVALSDSIRGHKISDYCTESPAVKAIVGILDEMESWIDGIPPLQQPVRYGNPAYRTWQERLQQEGRHYMLRVLPPEIKEAVVEIFPYFADSFGNAMRIDYGTGHETNFAAWLFCLARLGIIREIDYQAVVARVFVRYLGVMRRLQMTYFLEPAGSHGVWGLDDYHFLPFAFGSSQLVDHKYMRPKSIHNQDILDNFSNEYLYLSCVAFVKKMKKGLLAEHSPMIDDISGVANWAKVNSGMLKMYKAEVLEKVPIMQHFLFGSIIKWEEAYT